MKLRLAAIFVSLSAALASPAAADKPLFASDQPLQLIIQAPLQTLIYNRQNDSPITGTLTEAGGQPLPISLKLRGITRRTSEVCDFPPLRVDFTTPPPATSAFVGQKHLKLVTHCRSSAAHQQLILLEYSAYRMLNLLSPRSFRARLANIDYRGANGSAIVNRVRILHRGPGRRREAQRHHGSQSR